MAAAQPAQNPPSWYAAYGNVSQEEAQQIHGWFYQVDTDRSGQISADELGRALALGGTTCQPTTINRLIKAFDSDNSGQIVRDSVCIEPQLWSVQEIYQLRTPVVVSVRDISVESDTNGMTGLQEFVAMHKFLETMRNSFLFFDQDRSGQLDLGELFNALTRSGYQVSQQSFYAFVPKFDVEKRGVLSFDQYLDLCIWLGNMRKLWGYYDPWNQGRITLTFDQLLACAPYYYE